MGSTRPGVLLARLAAAAWALVPAPLRGAVMAAYPRGRFRVGVLALVTNPRGEVLLLRHRFRAGSPWGLPGGWLEPGESPEEGMRRELAEELDMAPSALTLLDAVSRPRRPHVEIFFRVDADEVDPAPNVEFDEHRFFDVGRLPLEMLEHHRRIVERLVQAGRDISGGAPGS